MMTSFLQKTGLVNKQHIMTLFNNNVRGMEISLQGKNPNHCGVEGHWLETQMGIKHNANNQPDIGGFEMKKHSGKTTLGDFSASEYAFSTKNKRSSINLLNCWTDETKLTRSEFIRIFGNPNPKKDNRHSWSGSCVPTYNTWNSNGQMLTVTENNDIVVYYSFSRDTRSKKWDFPAFLRNERIAGATSVGDDRNGVGENDHIVIALWKSEKLKPHIDNKFNKEGFFICKKVGGKYEKICFGRAFDFEYFIECIKNKKIIFDSGMYDGNSRNYSQFRGSRFWDELITEEY
jgi:hypothetical protein